jgi:hypothetical protein
LVEQSLDGGTAARSLRSAFSDAGGGRLAVARYSPADLDVRPALEELRARRVSAVVVQASPRGFDSILGVLREMGAAYRTTATARKGGRAKAPWRPQVIGLDAAVHSADPAPSPGTVAADSYARGVHYLPVPSLQAFRSRFVDWWGEQPLGWEVRAYQAVQMVGWAELRTDRGGDVASTLERLRRARFGGLDVTLGPDDHTAVEQTTIGLWTIPRPGADVSERGRLPESLPWVPIARTFSIDGEVTDVLPEDWRHLFRGETREDRPAPKFRRMRFGVTTPRSDPVH